MRCKALNRSKAIWIILFSTFYATSFSFFFVCATFLWRTGIGTKWQYSWLFVNTRERNQSIDTKNLTVKRNTHIYSTYCPGTIFLVWCYHCTKRRKWDSLNPINTIFHTPKVLYAYITFGSIRIPHETKNIQFNLTFLCFKAESITNDSTIFVLLRFFFILLSAKCSLKTLWILKSSMTSVHNTNLSAFRFGLLGAVDASRLHSHTHIDAL